MPVGARSVLNLPLHLAIFMTLSALPVLVAIGLGSSDVVVGGKGQIEFRSRSHVSPSIAGRVAHMHVTEGARVVTGQVLLELDVSEQRASAEMLARMAASMERVLADARREREVLLRAGDAEQAVAGSAVLVAQGEEQLVHTDVDSHSSRLRSGAMSGREARQGVVRLLQATEALTTARRQRDGQAARRQAELLAFDQQIATQESELAQTRAEEAQNLRRVAGAKVRATTCGVVLTARPHLLVGRWLEPGEQVLEVGDPEELVFETYIAANDVATVAPGQPVRVNLDAYPRFVHGSLDGEVIALGYEPERPDGGAIYFRVQVALDDGDVDVFGVAADGLQAVRPGLTGEAIVITDESGPIWRLLWRRLQPILPSQEMWR